MALGRVRLFIPTIVFWATSLVIGKERGDLLKVETTALVKRRDWCGVDNSAMAVYFTAIFLAEAIPDLFIGLHFGVYPSEKQRVNGAHEPFAIC